MKGLVGHRDATTLYQYTAKLARWQNGATFNPFWPLISEINPLQSGSVEMDAVALFSHTRGNYFVYSFYFVVLKVNISLRVS
jgi:hypothetical protein